LPFYPLTEDIRTFIRENQNTDINKLLLQHKTIESVPTTFIVDQIVGRKKAKAKFASLLSNDQIVFPPSINLEQSSSEETATYKKQFIENRIARKNSGLDLTGGFGIDTISFASIFKTFHYVEPNEDLLKIVRHNFSELKIDNVAFHINTAEAFIGNTSDKFDFIFIDPSRRVDNRKLITFRECVPDVNLLQSQLLEKTDVMMVKASPLMDIKQGLRELKGVERVIVVSLKNDCKEVLFVCCNDFAGEPAIEAVNLATSHPPYSFTFREEDSADIAVSDAKDFIYEPNASILKAGAFKLIASRYQIAKVHRNTHLYTSNSIVPNFPGRVFRILTMIRADQKGVSNIIQGNKANVMTRNYPLSPEALKKKLKIEDGGEQYIIGFSDSKKKLVLAERVD
jgi:16S rRNA G966 N2-methylase RsmD